MKTILILILLLLLQPAQAQSGLSPMPVAFDTLSHLDIDSLNDLKLSRTISRSGNVVCFASTEGTVLAYRLSRSGHWTLLRLPFSDAWVTIEEYNLDERGSREIIVRGEIRDYGSRCGTASRELLVFDVYKRPVLIMDLVYRCYEACFGGADGKGYVKGMGRKIRFGKGGISITRVGGGRADCSLTPVEAGRYVYAHGRVWRR